MNESDRAIRQTAVEEIHYHRDQAQAHKLKASHELEIAEYHIRQINTWGQFLANIGHSALQIVPELHSEPQQMAEGA